jgi:hypothetical protein
MFKLNLIAMKTKIFFTLCLLSGMGLIQLFAQANGKTGSVTYDYVWEFNYNIPVYNSNGVQIDLIDQGTVYYHHIGHFINGVEVWGKCQGFGEAVGSKGEVFRVQEINKADLIIMTGTCHVNLIGNQGSHYIETFIVDPSNGNLTFVSAISVGKNK